MNHLVLNPSIKQAYVFTQTSYSILFSNLSIIMSLYCRHVEGSVFY